MRTAIVTGGASGLGAAAAVRLRSPGVRVITVDKAEGADEVIDLTDVAAVSELADRVGAVDVLVNSAGVVGPNAPLVETTDEEWRHTFEINVVATVAMMRAFVPGTLPAAGGG